MVDIVQKQQDLAKGAAQLSLTMGKSSQSFAQFNKLSNQLGQSKTWQEMGAAIEKNTSRVQFLNQAISQTNNSQAAREFKTQQLQALKGMESQARTAQELVGFTQQRLKLENQLQSSQQVKQGAALAGGYLLGQGKALYDRASASYQSLNDRFHFDPALTQSESQLARSRLDLKAKLSGYNQFKNKAGRPLTRADLVYLPPSPGTPSAGSRPFYPYSKGWREVAAQEPVLLGMAGKGVVFWVWQP